jgi:hypothetical protein
MWYNGGMIKIEDISKLDWERIPSREFRKRYPRLEKPVIITSMDRPIGLWLPLDVTVKTQREPSTV